MLVLTRKQGEEVVIGDGIRVTVVAVSGNRVKLAFTAPKETRIHRAEVSLKIEGEEDARIAAEPIAKLVGCG